ncbi:hypothetical protein GHT06_007036 [Daphnia sinensis]|uniref:Uncharacterized protein n=1 Tax=Daphnia sinensis TaxID=1820382 RepID=A0AAD5PKW3_9CRUS|nr:hypothetical protein GHT06_007036 [Daphnia sinensis]
MALSDVVKGGIEQDPTIVAFLEKYDLKNIKNLNLNANSDKPISDIEPLFRTTENPILNGGYIAYCAVFDSSVVNDIAASMQLSANVTYQINGGAWQFITVKNFYFLVMFYENGNLKGIHTVVNNRLLLTLIALNEKASQVTSPTQSDWSQTDANEPSFIKNKPQIPTVVPQQQADWSQTDATAPSFIKNKPIISGGGATEQADWSQTDATAPSFIKNKPQIPTVVPQQQQTGHNQMLLHPHSSRISQIFRK